MAEPYLEILSNMINSLNLHLSNSVVLECKHFFSGAALYANGKMCVSLTPAGFGVKLPQEARDKILIEGKGTVLRYFENAPVKKEYVALSQSIIDDPVQMRSLLNKCIDYVLKREGAA